MAQICDGMFINSRREEKNCQKLREELQIKTPSLRQKVKNLSGGNQQKVVLAKWLTINREILIFDEPTRGIDVGAKQEIYQLMRTLAESGKSIIMISSEMPELLGMADRIYVMHEGRITGELSRAEYSQEKMLEMASGQNDTRGIL
jgi:ribose transport system ATP-binding protein